MGAITVIAVSSLGTGRLISGWGTPGSPLQPRHRRRHPGNAYGPQPDGDGEPAAARPPPAREVLVGTWQFAVGAGADSTVRYFDPSATQRAAVAAFNPPFSGGVQTAVADFNADGVPDIAVGTGPGARGHGCRLTAAGGVADHVHLLVSIGRDTSIADLVRVLKAASSRWIHDTFPQLGGFAWQSGYGAFSVSLSQTGAVEEYLARQAEHHRAVTYQEEYRTFLTKHGLEWDERYVWD